MIYWDTSFLIALYVEQDFFHRQAFSVARKRKEPIGLNLLSELELLNGIGRCLARKVISKEDYRKILFQIATDEIQGILIRQAIPQAEHYAKARELSKKFTPATFSRSLDILHVAAALILEADGFGSFDKRQRQLANKVGFKIIPNGISVKETPQI